MAKRRRLGPARMTQGPEGGSEGHSGGAGSTRAPIADMAGAAAATAALGEMEQVLRDAREQGLLIQKLPLDAIDETYLVRDRISIDPEETRTLVDSLRARGQQAPIEVADIGQGRWGLISGWRRVMALRQLQTEGGESTVLAILRKPEQSSDAYLAMVEENEIRVGLSYYERGRIAARAAEMGVYPSDGDALKGLFPTAPRSRRSKIGSFIRIVRALDAALRFPSALGEVSGLALAKALDVYPALAPALIKALKANPPQTAAEETAMIEKVCAQVAKATTAKAVDPAKGGRPPKPAPEQVELTSGLTAHVHQDGKIVLTGSLLKDTSTRADVLEYLQGIDSI